MRHIQIQGQFKSVAFGSPDGGILVPRFANLTASRTKASHKTYPHRASFASLGVQDFRAEELASRKVIGRR